MGKGEEGVGAGLHKKAEHTMVSKPVSLIPPRSLLEFLPWLPSRMDCNL